jgi:hypothetical protein
LHEGRVALRGSVADLVEEHRQLTFQFGQALPAVPPVAGNIRSSRNGPEWTVLCNGNRPQIEALARSLGAHLVADEPVGLDEIYRSCVAGNRPLERSVL